MKYVKYFGVYILMFLLFLCTANAKKCSVYFGTGENIGDEIVCGTEHFYVIENDGTNVELMAKYNLYVGANWTKEIPEEDKYVFRRECEDETCERNTRLIYSPVAMIEDDYGLYYLADDYLLRPTFISFEDYKYKKFGLYKSDETNFKIIKEGSKYYKEYSVNKIYIYEILNEKHDGYGRQNPLAIGVHGEKNNATYPIYAVFPLDGSGSKSDRAYSSYGETYEDGYYDFELNEGIEASYYLNQYFEILSDEEYEIKSINLPTISRINQLVYDIKGEYLPLKEWYHNAKLIEGESDHLNRIYEAGSIKNILDEKYNWIWGTSYWVRTMIVDKYDNRHDLTTFISTAGDLCYDDSVCYSIPRAGIRPIITMASDQIKSYKIETKSTNGKIEYTIEKGKVVMSLIPDESYELSSLKAYDSKNNEIKIENNTFDILNDDVTIEAIFSKVESPNTSSFTNIKYLIFALILLSIITILIKKQKIISK